MPDTNNELKDFGFTGKLRTGFVTAILGILFTAVGYLYIDNKRMSKDMLNMQERLYERMIPQVKKEVDERVDEKVQPMINTLDTISSSLTKEIERRNPNEK